jgi:hypothetical protein
LIHSHMSNPFQSFLLIAVTMSRCLDSSRNSQSVLIPNIPCSTTGPHILLNICWMDTCHFNNKCVTHSSIWHSKLHPAFVACLYASTSLANLHEFLICTLLFSV